MPSINDLLDKELRPGELSPTRSTLFVPDLRRDRPNAVLIFTGAFNPPHVGHLALLCQGFLRSGYDINMVLAIVLPRDDDIVRNKFKNTQETFILSKTERCKLWTNDSRFPGWARTFDGMEDDIDGLEERLIEAAGQDGYVLEFISLNGAEYARPNDPPRHACSGYDNAIFCQGSRDSPISMPCGLQTMQGYDPWAKIDIDVADFGRQALAIYQEVKDTYLKIAPENAQKFYDQDDPKAHIAGIVAKMKHNSQSIQQCRPKALHVAENRWLRYVRTPNIESMPPHERDMSSTRLRKALREGNKEDSNAMALSPELLWSFWNAKALQN